MIGKLALLEISFILLVGAMSALAGLFSLYVVAQQFRNNPRRRRSASRSPIR